MTTTNVPATTTAAAALQAPAKPAIVKFIEERQFQIAEMLPKHLPLERFVRLVYTEMRKNPDLLKCTPESVIGGMLTGAALGLEIGGALGEAFLVPYNVKVYNRELGRDEKRLEAEFIQGYKGIAKLFWQHPMSARLSAEYVCANDLFEYDKGLRPFLRHVPAQGERGEVVAYYAIVALKDREAFFDVFTPEQIKKIRGGKVGTKGDVGDPERWMERKTALLQVLKLAPKSTSLVSALAVDERSGADLFHAAAPKAINAGESLPFMPYAELDTGETVDTITGEVVPPATDSQPAPEPPPAPAPKSTRRPKPVTEPQLASLDGILAGLGINDPAERLWWVALAGDTGRPLNSVLDLTEAQAAVACKLLAGMADRAALEAWAQTLDPDGSK